MNQLQRKPKHMNAYSRRTSIIAYIKDCFPKTPTGIVTFRPLEVQFEHIKPPNERTIYCKISIAQQKEQTSETYMERNRAKWSEEVVVKRKNDEEFAELKVEDKERRVFNCRLGTAKIDLDVVSTLEKVKKWYNLQRGDKVIGKILMEISYKVDSNSRRT